jgi:hypothetical protein
MLFLIETYRNVRKGQSLSERAPTQESLKQETALSQFLCSLLFNKLLGRLKK